MLRPPHSTQEPPQIKAVESILDMDSDALANTKTIDEMLQALGSTSITIQASAEKQVKPKTEEKKPPPILTISQSFKINAARVKEIEKNLLAFDVQKARLYDDLPNLTSEFVANKASEESLDLSSSDTKKSKRISEEDKLIQALASNNKKTIAEQKLITYRDFLTETKQLNRFNQTLDRIEDLNNQETIFSNHLNLLIPLSLQPKITNEEKDLEIKQKKFNTPTISQSKELSPLSIFLQTSSFDTKQKKKLDELKAETAESIFPIKESDPQPDSQSSGAPPLPPHVANWAKSCLAEKQGEKASWKMQAESIKNNSEIEALRASKAEAIERHRRLEVESYQIKQELEEIEQRNEALSDSISLDNPNLEEVIAIARAEELAKVLEEKIEQESRTRIEALKIQQELQIQEALLRARKDGEIPGLRPRKEPNQSNEISWTDRYLAGFRGGEPQEPAPKQKTSLDSLLPQGLYPPFQTLSGLQTLGAGPFALGLGNTQPQAPIQERQAPAQDLSSSKQLAPAKTSPQNLQANANNDQVVVSPRNLPEGTSSIFMQVSKDANLGTNENDQNLDSSIVSDVDQLLENLSVAEAIPLSATEANLSADELLGGLQSEDLEQVQDLTNLHQSTIPVQQPIPNLEQNNPGFIVLTSIEEELLQNIEQTGEKLGSSAPPDETPPTQSRDESQTSSIDEGEENIPQTIPLEQEEKKQFWQTFISTRLREKPSNSNQNLPGNNEDDLSQDELVTGSNPNSPTLESEDLNVNTVLNFPYSTIQPIKIDEIEERKRKLYTILKTNLEKQITKESNPISKNEEEIDAKTAENNIETVMDYIATYTSNLASSISKNENKQTEGAPSSEASDPQTTQNSSTDDPIIYSGIGIRIKLEKEENGECSLKITEVFENSRLEKEDVNKKITHIKCGDELKSISDIYGDCGGNEEKFYTKIALIFRDEKQEKLTLKIEGEEQERNVVKNIFIPEDKKGLNIYDNSQMTKIADKLIASRQNFSQLTTSRGGKGQTA